MPIHDWTLVRANRFHDFLQGWTIAICNALNDRLILTGCFAMIEQKGGPAPDIIAFDLNLQDDPLDGCFAVDLHPPRVSFMTSTATAGFAKKANRITILHPDDDVVAVIEIISPGNKNSRDAIRAFTRKAVQFLQAGVHLLIVDLFPPSRRDPQGIHKAIWDRINDEPFTLPAGKPLTAAAYVAGSEMVAYGEPLAVGDPLPDMPVFLTPQYYVPCPLEAAYRTAWEQIPAPLKEPLEQPPV